MQGIRHNDHCVFLYRTMLHTASPLLKEMYCESHRLEPWAVDGSERRAGRYVFPQVLYVEAEARDRLLGDILRRLAGEVDWVDSVTRRFDASSRRHQRLLVRAQGGDRSGGTLEGLIDETCRVLSCGIFKEVFEYREALDFLARYMPVRELRNTVLALYQPLCIPHFLKFEMKLAFFSGLYAERRDEELVRRCIAQCAHHSRFLIEDTPYDAPDTMRAEMEKMIAGCGGSASRVRGKRRELIRRHREAVRRSLVAERDILQAMDAFGGYTLRTKLIVKNCLTFIQFIATYEELKHIFSVQTARILGEIMRADGLPVETTDTAGLLRALR